MANTGVNGKIVFTGTTNGIADLIVQIVDLDGVPDEQTLGWGRTNSSGNFSVTYDEGSYGFAEWEPDIVVRVYDEYLRLLHETPEESDVTSTTLTIPDIELHPDNVAGWLVTNATINPSGTPVNLSAGNRVEFIIDNETAWAELTDQAAAATNSINFMILFFQVPEVITKFIPSMPPLGSAVAGEKLQEKLRDTANSRLIPVRVLANDFQIHLPGSGVVPTTVRNVVGNLVDSAAEISNFFSGSSVQVALYPTIIPSPLHAKLMILDGTTAYLIGSPIMNEYFDTHEHLIRDPRRGKMVTPVNSIKVPIHEVNTKVNGPAVADIDETFTQFWNTTLPSGSTPLSPAIPPAASSGSDTASVQVIRTIPGGRLVSSPVGETGILEGYQRAIAKAEDFIYIEDQYFTSIDLAEALARRLKINSTVQVILLVNIKVDIPGYSSLQPRVLNALLDATERDGTQDRLTIFTLWSHEPGTPTTIMRNYVHSKTAIIDDKWATVGSANTDGTSLNETQAGTWYIPRLAVQPTQSRSSQHANPNFSNQPFRAVELNLAIYNDVAGQPSSSIITDLRRRLWQEHLGYSSPTDAALMTRPGGGWLSLWKERERQKFNGLRATPPVVRDPRILALYGSFPSDGDAANYLRLLSVDVTQLQIKEEVNSFDFSTGLWV